MGGSDRDSGLLRGFLAPALSGLSLREKRYLFAREMAHFQVWIFMQGLEIWEGEAFRPAEVAEIYAKTGRGIRNSNHRRYLARDLFLIVDSTISWNADDYEVLGREWKRRHPLARWGGDFKNRDAVHFSFEHNGVM